jgi:hypothetical protein
MNYTAVRAVTAELRFGARRAEGTLEGAAPRLRRLGREITITTFNLGYTPIRRSGGSVEFTFLPLKGSARLWHCNPVFGCVSLIAGYANCKVYYIPSQTELALMDRQRAELIREAEKALHELKQSLRTFSAARQYLKSVGQDLTDQLQRQNPKLAETKPCPDRV